MTTLAGWSPEGDRGLANRRGLAGAADGAGAKGTAKPALPVTQAVLRGHGPPAAGVAEESEFGAWLNAVAEPFLPALAYPPFQWLEVEEARRVAEANVGRGARPGPTPGAADEPRADGAGLDVADGVGEELLAKRAGLEAGRPGSRPARGAVDGAGVEGVSAAHGGGEGALVGRDDDEVDVVGQKGVGEDFCAEAAGLGGEEDEVEAVVGLAGEEAAGRSGAVGDEVGVSWDHYARQPWHGARIGRRGAEVKGNRCQE